MFEMSVGIGELIFRAAVVFLFLFMLLRFIGKKHIGELAPFDLVVLLILSETVQSSMVGADQSLMGGLVAATTLMAIAHGTNWLTHYSKQAARVVDGVPKVIVRNGHCFKSIMADEKITMSELLEAMRQEGCTNILNVRVAMLENDGRISIVTR